MVSRFCMIRALFVGEADRRGMKVCVGGVLSRRRWPEGVREGGWIRCLAPNMFGVWILADLGSKL